jgi:AcrR family transcriptional regulator
VTSARAAGDPDPRVARSRQRTLAAALDLVAERGVAGATIEAVSARSGVARTTIYRQWPHQGRLVLDAFRSIAPDPPSPDTGTLRGDLVLLLGGLAEALRSTRAGELMPALIDASQRDPEFAQLHAQEVVRRHQPVLAVLRRGVRRGELPVDVDLDDLVDRLAGPVIHRRFVSGLPLDAGFAERVVDRVLRAP